MASSGRIRRRRSSWAGSARAWRRSAGSHADGINTQAGHPQLADLIGVARVARANSGRDPAGLVVTVFGGLRDSYLRPDASTRQSLERLGVDRVILLVEPPFDSARIRAAGQLLR